MGNSHIDSNLVAKDGNETISGFRSVTVATVNATNVVGLTKVKATSYLQLGTNQYMFFGDSGKSATIVAEATALVGTPIKGSLYLSTRGEAWVYTTDAAASPLSGTYSSP